MSSNRIAYIDALRGFTMILVVMNHVSEYCFGLPYELDNYGSDCYSFAPYLKEFRMPLFFFISGFVLYKPSAVWRCKEIISFFRKKIPVQLLSPFLFFSIYLFINGISYYEGLFSTFKKGYWFTFTLFELYVFYALARFISQKCKLNSIIEDTIILCWSFVIVVFAKYILVGNIIFNLLGAVTWRYFVFFVLGTLSRKHFSLFECLLDKGRIIIVSVLLFIGLNLFHRWIPIQSLSSFLLALSGIVIIFSFFRKIYNQLGDNGNENMQAGEIHIVMNSPLQFIGRRTLDIYLLHFFFLPRKMIDFFPLFRDIQIPTLELFCSMFISLLVIIVCLFVGEILRINPVMAHWLFGAKLDYGNANYKK